MARPVTFTLDLEDHRPDDSVPERYPEVTRRLLEHLAAREVRGTVFVVGEVAQRHPELVEAVVAQGHEVGLHAWRHVPLAEVGAAQFGDEIGRGRELLRSITGQEVLGFRAPTYSLVRATTWAVPILSELGFTYSSSTLPGPNPLFGFPELPNRPFRWPTGLVEFPGPIVHLGPWAIAPIGGTYLRVLPWPVVAAAMWALPRSAVLHAYCHPYDFDAEEPYWLVGDVPRAMNRLLWVGRRGMLDRLDRVLAGGVGPPLGELVDHVDARTIEMELADA